MNKKHSLSVIICLACFVVSTLFTACLNPLNFDPEAINNVKVSGDINTTDVTSAVLMLVNRSKTVDITKVTITQEKSKTEPPPSISFTNKPKRLERKAQYLPPSDNNYIVVIEYTFEACEKTPAGTGTKTKSIPLPIPKEVYNLYIYRDKDGEVIIDHVMGEYEPDDTGNPPPVDPMAGEGSSPAVIPPENRTKMATFVLINKSNSQNIDNISFEMNGVIYTVSYIGAADKQSIALGQGAWETNLKYTAGGASKTLGPKNSVIVPSNDPQSVREHYLYFYKTKSGDFNTSQEWPPYPNDADEGDMVSDPADLIPVNITSAVLMLINLTNTVDVTNVHITQPKASSGVDISFTNMPQRQTTKAQYLPPSDVSYQVEISYKSSAYGGNPEKTGKETKSFALPLSKNTQKYYIYRGKDGNIYVGDEVIDSDPGDTSYPPGDPFVGEGSSPAVIPYENRTTMATFIVVNKTSSQKIDSTKFQMDGRSYTMGQVKATDKQSIALSQGTWLTAVNYTPPGGAQKETTSKNSVIVPSNDPQAIRDHYMYFYKTKNGDYNISHEWPPYPNDADDDGANSGVGAKVTLFNKTTSGDIQITGMTVVNETSHESSGYGPKTWSLGTAIGSGGSAVQYVTGSSGMRILKGDTFYAMIDLWNSNYNRTDHIIKSFDRPELYSELPPDQNTRNLTIDDSDITGGLGFVPVKKIDLTKNTMTVVLNGGIVVSGGSLNLNNYAVVSPGNATNKAPINWKVTTVSGSINGVAVGSLPTTGIITVTGRLTSDSSGTIEVTGTIPNGVASGTDFVGGAYTIYVTFKDEATPPIFVPVTGITASSEEVTIQVGEYFNLSTLLKLNPADAIPTLDDITWSGTGSCFSLIDDGPFIKGLTVGTGTITATLPAAKNGGGAGAERTVTITVKVISGGGKEPVPAGPRVLPPVKTDDTVNWLEIAKNGSYSLIVRTDNIGKTIYGSTYIYNDSNVRTKINDWFKSTLSPTARLRNFTVKNDALTVTGTSNNTASMTNGFSTPTDTYVSTGNDVAFALSWSEAANFLSKTHRMRGMSTERQPSSDSAQKAYEVFNNTAYDAYGNKGITRNSGRNCMWLRSRAETISGIQYAGALDDPDFGDAFQFEVTYANGYVFPALWVHQSIWD